MRFGNCREQLSHALRPNALGAKRYLLHHESHAKQDRKGGRAVRYSFRSICSATLLLSSLCIMCTVPADAEHFGADLHGVVYVRQGRSDMPLDSLTAWTELAGCTTRGEAQVGQLPGGAREYRRTLQDEAQSHECVLTERPTSTASGMRWDIEILGKGAPWTTAIETCLLWKNTHGLTWWTAWGDSRPDAPRGERQGAPQGSVWWNDPLVPAAFADIRLFYGGRDHNQPQAFSIPLVSVLNPATDQAISLVLSPEDIIFDMNLEVTAAGTMTLSRMRHRITPEHPVRFSMDLICHKADWRAALGWMVEHYPQFFDPPNPKVHEMAGCGAYSSHVTTFDAERLRRMAFKVNWKASFDFPYMGMFIPPVPDDTTEWTDFKLQRTSISKMRNDIRCFTEKGFYVLNYFNVTEFGNYIKYPPPPRKATRDADLWRDPNDFVYYVLGNAILKRAAETKPLFSWEGSIAMDPGDPVYQQFLVKQAQRHIVVFPESSGICIDRMDWLRYFNTQCDDGVSWAHDGPARSLVMSWHEIIARIGTIMHANGKVIYCNPHYRRVDLLRHVDGIYDEFGQMGHSMNLCALLGLRKPVMAWTILVPELEHAPDAYFQRHLHMGAYPTAPLPGNDHTILPSDDVDQIYFDYGPMLDALRGKRWVLKPHAVTVQDEAAKANVFAVPDGYVVPVTFGPGTDVAHAALRHLERQIGHGTLHAEVIHPGKTAWAPLNLTEQGDVITLDVPLERGCAMVRLR